jgi:hypothetical protein
MRPKINETMVTKYYYVSPKNRPGSIFLGNTPTLLGHPSRDHQLVEVGCDHGQEIPEKNAAQHLTFFEVS